MNNTLFESSLVYIDDATDYFIWTGRALGDTTTNLIKIDAATGFCTLIPVTGTVPGVAATGTGGKLIFDRQWGVLFLLSDNAADSYSLFYLRVRAPR